MELSIEETERLLNKIFTSREWTYINDKLVLFKQPDNYTKMQADLIYDKSYNKAVSTGLLPVADLEKMIDERGIISEEDKEELERLNNQLFAQGVLLSKTTKVKAKQDRLKKIISELKSKIATLEFKRTSKLSLSAEAKAEEERALYLCWSCAFNDDETPFWDSFENILNERDVELKDKVLVKFLRFKAGVNTSTVRYLARHSLWRIRYVTSQKVSDPLFGVPTSQYTNDMLNLAYWSNFYQNIYEMMPKDRPPDSIIEDDEALDAYMKAFYEERNREDASERAKHQMQSSRGTLSAFDKQEVIVTRSNELYEDIDYDKPREAQRIKDRSDLKKRTRRPR